MGDAQLLQPVWQTKKIVFCNVFALVLLLLWAWPLTHDLAMRFDIAFFRVLNDSLKENYVWASIWAIMSSRFFDMVVAIILLVLLIKADWLYSAKVVRQAFFALLVIMLLQVVVRIIFTKLIIAFGWQHASPTATLDDAYRLSRHFDFFEQKLEIKDSSNRSFPGDHASVLMIWALFLSVFARKFSQYFIVWLLAIIFMMPRLIAGAHWASDDYVGGLILALLALGWGMYTPFAAKLSSGLVRITKPIFRLVNKIPVLNRLAIVRYPE